MIYMTVPVVVDDCFVVHHFKLIIRSKTKCVVVHCKVVIDKSASRFQKYVVRIPIIGLTWPY